MHNDAMPPGVSEFHLFSSILLSFFIRICVMSVIHCFNTKKYIIFLFFLCFVSSMMCFFGLIGGSCEATILLLLFTFIEYKWLFIVQPFRGLSDVLVMCVCVKQCQKWQVGTAMTAFFKKSNSVVSGMLFVFKIQFSFFSLLF